MYRYIKAIAAMAISAAIFPAPGLCAYADNDYLAGTNPEGEMETTTSNTVTVDYVGNFVYENGTLTRILFEGGYVDMTGAAPEYMFYLTDHLGNVRVVADSEGNIVQVNHYYPYGDRFSDGRYALPSSSTRDNDRLFGGKELDSSSGLHDFEARYDNTRFGRFTTMDPMAEKYYGISPYSYCAGNPINLIDAKGLDTWRFNTQGMLVDNNPIPNDENDIFVVVQKDENGSCEEIDGSKVTMPSGSVSQHKGNSLLFSIQGKTQAKEAFETMANNTRVEWSYVTYTDGRAAEVGTNGRAASNGTMIESVTGRESVLEEVIHSHPTLPYPSPKDIQFYGELMNNADSNRNNILVKLYYVLSGDYIPYNENGPLYDLNLYECF